MLKGQGQPDSLAHTVVNSAGMEDNSFQTDQLQMHTSLKKPIHMRSHPTLLQSWTA